MAEPDLPGASCLVSWIERAHFNEGVGLMLGVGARGAVWGRAVVVAVVLGLAAVVARPVESLAASNVELVAAKAQPRGSVYLFLGLLNVFSTGLDTLSGELKAKGVPNTAMNYAGWMGPAADIEAR